MAKKYEHFCTRDIISDMRLEEKLKKLDSERTRNKRKNIILY